MERDDAARGDASGATDAPNPDARTHRLEVRFTSSEWRRVRIAAANEDRRVANFIRMATLDRVRRVENGHTP